jgi:predicted outer membrane repeat protein
MDGGGAILNFSNNTLTLDSCTFTHNSSEETGGAIQNEPPLGGGVSTLIFTNCTFAGNRANSGGAIFNGGDLSLIDCTFSANLSHPEGWGGGAAIANHGIAIADNCTFTKNISRDEDGEGGFGGAIFNSYELLLTNSIFIDNVVSSDLFEIREEGDLLVTGIGGAVYSESWGGEWKARIDSCLFTGNSAGLGGGLYLEGSWGEQDQFEFINCTVVGNWARYYGGGLLLDSSVEATNCIIRDNRAVLGPQVATWWAWEGGESRISYCDVEGGEDDVFLWDMWGPGALIDWGEGNIDADPCFADSGYWDPNDTPADPNDDFWVDGDYHLTAWSPCIDVGDNSVVDANGVDFDGNPRISDGDIDGWPVVDMGAYEALPPVEADVHIIPRVINRRSHMKRIIAIMRLPEDLRRRDVAGEPFELYVGAFDTEGIEATWQRVIGGPNGARVFALFDKDEFMDIVTGIGRRELTVVGKLESGQYIYGSDTVRIIPLGRGRRRWRRR